MGIFGIKTDKKNSKKKKEQTKIPKTAQDSIPYEEVYENGIIRLDENTYSKAYRINDTNFSIASLDDQKQIVKKYMDFLGSFGADINVQILIYNKTVGRVEFEQKVLIPMCSDGLNEYREEINNMLIAKMASARNNIIHDKYLAVTIEADDIEDAINKFVRIDLAAAEGGRQLSGAEFRPLTIRERLETLYSIYHMDSNTPLYQSMKMKDGGLSESYTLKMLAQRGMTTKDLIATYMSFESDHFRVGDMYGRALFINNLPTIIRADILTELANMPFNMLTSIHYKAMQQTKALKKVSEQTTNINSNVITQQQRASKKGYSPDLISPKYLASQRSASQLLNDITKDNMKLFVTTLCVCVFAETKEQLEEYTKTVQATAERFICSLQKLYKPQELAFNSCLPLGKNWLPIERVLHAAAAAAFNPFSVKEFFHPSGFYYGLNALSKQLIIYDRRLANNGNGCIFGIPGSGKSFMAKMLITFIKLCSTDDILVIDVEEEYTMLAELLDGNVIRLAPGSGVYINPMDLDIDYSDKDDPIALKTDFVESLCESITGSRYPMSPIMHSIINRCVKNIYGLYVEELNQSGKKFDSDIVPTLGSLYEELLQQPEVEAHNMALSIERFVTGTQDCFSQRTNVDIKNSFTVYNIKDLGSGMKNMGLQVCLDNIWNRMIQNWRRGKRTWIFCDEFHELVATESSAKYTRQIWKRARKWDGIPTGMTQNVEDMLRSAEGRAVINNCDFVMMLNLDPYSRMQMQQMFNLSDKEMEYVTGVPAGQGLLYTGSDIIPFVNEFPTDTKLYKAMTTKPEERIR
ncbi:MAG TPA: DUF87 domain-containing protein [Candidatus Blautia faecavium]|uniref:DUF87 domain-containing protein n=1 Tax=Candidatus Blautia faecavium TaxID=2838487 RepID=A0A9D2RUH5_9FIRM|nr:DUF87 domain-containing protein [Candidatus Blautia faecavium]